MKIWFEISVTILSYRQCQLITINLQCVLASIIVVALKGMLMQVTHFKDFWKLSRLDATVWMATFLSVVIFAIDIGLLVGIILSLACIFIRGMKPYTCLLGHVPQTDLYLDVGRYKAVSIFKYDTHLEHACILGTNKTTSLSWISQGTRDQFHQNIPLLWEPELCIARFIQVGIVFADWTRFGPRNTQQKYDKFTRV